MYLTNFNKITDIKYNVQFIYPQALEELKLKLNKTEEEFNKEGIFIDQLPPKEKLDDYYSMLYVNPQTKDVWWEYIKKSNISDVSLLQGKIDELSKQLIQIQEYAVSSAYNNLLSGGTK